MSEPPFYRLSYFVPIILFSWIDVYNIVNLLEKNRMPVVRGSGGDGEDFTRAKKINNIAAD